MDAGNGHSLQAVEGDGEGVPGYVGVIHQLQEGEAGVHAGYHVPNERVGVRVAVMGGDQRLGFHQELRQQNGGAKLHHVLAGDEGLRAVVQKDRRPLAHGDGDVILPDVDAAGGVGADPLAVLRQRPVEDHHVGAVLRVLCEDAEFPDPEAVVQAPVEVAAVLERHLDGVGLVDRGVGGASRHGLDQVLQVAGKDVVRAGTLSHHYSGDGQGGAEGQDFGEKLPALAGDGAAVKAHCVSSFRCGSVVLVLLLV